RDIDAFQSLLNRPRTFIRCQDPLARGDQFSCYSFQIVSFHSSVFIVGRQISLASTRGLTCVIRTTVLSRIILSIATAAALFTAPAGLTARSCILSSSPEQKACQSSCCANKSCCAVSSENKSTPSQPLAKADSGYKLNASWVALATAVSPSQEVGSQQCLFLNAASDTHSPPTLALICIRLI